MTAEAPDATLVAERGALYVPSPRSHLTWLLVFVAVPMAGWVAQLAGAPDWVGLSTLAATVVLLLVAWPIDRYVYERRIESAISRALQTTPQPAELVHTEDRRAGRAELLVFARSAWPDGSVYLERRRIGRYFAYHLAITRDGQTVRHPIGGRGFAAVEPLIASLRSGR